MRFARSSSGSIVALHRYNFRQAQRQGEFLLASLKEHQEALRGKYLLGLRQGGFRHMPLDSFVLEAPSPDALQDRSGA